MTFESLRHQISHFVHAARDPLLRSQLVELCDMAVDEKQLADTIFNMCRAQELTKHPAPEGSGKGVRFAYGPGKNKPGAEPERENPTGGGDRKPPIEKPARRSKGKHRKKRSHKVEKVQRGNSVSRRAAAAHAKRSKVVQGWVLTTEGAFWLLGGEEPIQLKTETARDLVKLVRAGADLDGLVEFIKKLDKGQA